MKQLYVIGIIVAVMLLILLGLNKLNNAPKGAPADATPQVEEQQTEENVIISSSTEPTTMDTPTAAENTTVVMKTNKGDITIELFTKDMPVTAGNFLKLAQSDFYDGIKFHRVIENFMIQGGDPFTKDDALASRWGTGDPGYKIPDEFGPRYTNARGTLSMANAGPNTGGSQFFISTADNTFLDGKHPVFGRVISGMDVVDAISKVPQSGAPSNRPLAPVVINDIVVQ